MEFLGRTVQGLKFSNPNILDYKPNKNPAFKNKFKFFYEVKLEDNEEDEAFIISEK